MLIRPLFPNNPRVDQTLHAEIVDSLTAEELMWIDNLVKLYPYQEATISADRTIEDAVRKSKIKWLSLDEKSHWLYEKLAFMAHKCNIDNWNFNLNSIIDDIQYTEYHDDGGHYTWHMDIGPQGLNHRKVSITIQLSDPSEYEGGELQILSHDDNHKVMEKKKGSAVLFPSFLVHRVTPVTKGIRRSLVLWVGGDSYK
jgi:PKHD-type hydroxylase